MGRDGMLCGSSRKAAAVRHAAERLYSIVMQSWRRVSLALTLSACSPAPSQVVLGSFFPSWILCGVIGVAIAVGARQVLVSTAVDQHLLLPAITYFAVAIAASMLAWLFWFGR